MLVSNDYGFRQQTASRTYKRDQVERRFTVYLFILKGKQGYIITFNASLLNYITYTIHFLFTEHLSRSF